MSITPEQADGKRGAEVLDLDEQQWLPRHVRGDGTAFPALMSAYRAPIWNYLARCGVTGPPREDLFQEIFLKIHQSAARYRASWPLRPWIFTIAANTLRNHARDRARRRKLFSSGEAPEPVDPAPRLDDSAMIAETRAWLDSAIARLPFSQREVLVLIALESLPLREVAAILRIPQNTVKTRLRRARLKLAELLAEHERGTQGDVDD